ncbi:MAG: hypothetical protein QNJ84_16815 [Alphaproteobacteria bacterium]|nr:hypothetical protein [Alphaproteobacteria bacterium]
MSSDDFTLPNQDEQFSAVQLRERIAEQLLEEAKKAAAEERQKDEGLREAYDAFMARKLTDEDRARYRRMVESAVRQGLFEIELIRFPAEYLTDHGRRINNGASDWQVSLTGFAKSLHESFELFELGDRGFKFLARVLNYPKGYIGDIGLYVSWK